MRLAIGCQLARPAAIAAAVVPPGFVVVPEAYGEDANQSDEDRPGTRRMNDMDSRRIQRLRGCLSRHDRRSKDHDMTRDQIKGRARRSACEDADPWFDCAAAAMIFAHASCAEPPANGVLPHHAREGGMTQMDD